MSNIPISERSQFVGASEVAALFRVHPHLSKFELWHLKAGKIPGLDNENERVFWGSTLEPAVARGLMLSKGWKVHKVHRHIKHKTVKGMAASLDYEIVAHVNGPGVLEVKTVDYLIFMDWGEVIPLHYEIQLQHQLSVTGRKWGAIALLVAGNELHVFERQRNERLIARIEQEVKSFWDSIKAGVPALPDYEIDLQAIRALYPHSNGKTVDMSGDNRLVECCSQYQIVSAQLSELKKKQEALKAEIYDKIGNNKIVRAGEYQIKTSEIAATQIAHTRSSFRQLRIKEDK